MKNMSHTIRTYLIHPDHLRRVVRNGMCADCEQVVDEMLMLVRVNDGS